jgi:hypothetical protein
VARAMGIKPLTDDKIIIGKFTGDQADVRGDILHFDTPGYLLDHSHKIQTKIAVEVDHSHNIESQVIKPVAIPTIFLLF